VNDYYITRVEGKKVQRFARLHTKKTGIPYGVEWAEIWGKHVEWYGAKDKGIIKGVLGLMTCYSLPDELMIVCLYGNPHAVKVLIDYFLGYPQKHKFGSIEVRNEGWIKSLEKRNFKVEEELEVTPSGSKSVVISYGGGGYGK
jgi:hypothetical protein